MQKRRNWNRGELIVAFYQYCVTPYGKIHNRNPELIKLSEQMGRSTNSLAMKMCNFASFDPVQQIRDVKGLSNASKGDRAIWDEFSGSFDLLLESYRQELDNAFLDVGEAAIQDELVIPGKTEKLREVKVRIAQSFFRRSVLGNYNYQCAICRLDNPKLLNASHIVPWSIDEKRRADPKNGLSLCALHDRAFDRGLLTLDEDFRVVLSNQLTSKTDSQVHRTAFDEMEGVQIAMPDKFAPAQDALEYHRNNIFIQKAS